MNGKKKLEDLIDHVVKEGGSDLHLAEEKRPAIRVTGSLVQLIKYDPLTQADIMEFLSEMLTPKNKEKFLLEKEVDFSYTSSDVRFRGNCFFQRGLIGIALRLIPKQIKTIEDLHLPSILESFAQKQQGFFLVAGPVGQGKSTTLASLIELINRERSEHIVTIEDPIEYVYEAKKSIIDQREVGIDTKDFAQGLKSMFRQDVDVALIGEMRGPETIAAAVTAAETGHLIFSTLHTNTASQTIDRIIDSFPAEQQNQICVQLSNSLTGILSQRLIPRISGGLIPAYELLINNKAIANLIRERRTYEIDSVIETSSQKGMMSLNKSLADLVRNGEITIENAYKHSTNVNMLEKLI
ncbi:type IV pili twitching motility protein PilT [Candidatus Campbellbacteria bacterium RIFOXYC2_FULL_35_25]|uniref:Type IV pili twitching motility protein PilT n=1 Tax=Candidatus Campbellbacteria bacterium RIFOXYC2_FULL_35_25 TaxID=1797582 RepID=A0A1F5EIH4_9BACT|nr:MAG: type IV pili twitching motility protein PilT [Candidatus Campbellbacteria bacterium RIFOXYC2_FULL_35_25]